MTAPVDVTALPDPYAVPLETLDVGNPRIYHEDAHYRFLNWLRRVDYTVDRQYGPYWSVTKYKDIIKVEVTHQVFRRAGNMAAG